MPPADRRRALRPFDDPAWQDLLRWYYNILCHRCVEPIYPDNLGESETFDKLIELTALFFS